MAADNEWDPGEERFECRLFLKHGAGISLPSPGPVLPNPVAGRLDETRVAAVPFPQEIGLRPIRIVQEFALILHQPAGPRLVVDERSSRVVTHYELRHPVAKRFVFW